MSGKRPTYKELHQKLRETEAQLNRLRGVDGDKITSGHAAASESSEPGRAGGSALPDSRQMAVAYAASEQNFRNSIDGCPLGVRIVTEDGRLIYANQAILDICGYATAAELEAVPKERLYTPESYAGHLIRKKRRQQGEHLPPEYEIDIRRPDGAVRNLQVFRKEILWGGARQYLAVP